MTQTADAARKQELPHSILSPAKPFEHEAVCAPQVLRKGMSTPARVQIIERLVECER